MNSWNNLARRGKREKISAEGLQNDTIKDSEKIIKAQERTAWRESSEYRRIRRLENWIMYSLIPVASIGAAIGWFYGYKMLFNNHEFNETSGSYFMKDAGIGALIGVAAIMYLGVVIRNHVHTRARTEFKDRVLLSQAQAELRRAENEIKGEDVNFGTLWAVTQQRLDYYHKIATTQAERSFMYGQIATGADFFAIIIAALIAGFSRSTAAAIASGVTGVSGGGLGAY